LKQAPGLPVPAASAIGVLERRVQALKHDLKGVIRLTCPEPTVSRIVATGLLDRFYERYPGLSVEFVTSDRYLDIAKGEADVAFRSGEPSDDSLIGRKICDSIWAIYASKSYIQQHGRPTRIADLVDHAMIGFDGIMQNHRAAKWLPVAVPNARVVNRNNSMLGTLSAIKAGIGVAPLPTTLGDAEETLVQVLPPVEELTRGPRGVYIGRSAKYFQMRKLALGDICPLFGGRCATEHHVTMRMPAERGNNFTNVAGLFDQ